MPKDKNKLDKLLRGLYKTKTLMKNNGKISI